MAVASERNGLRPNRQPLLAAARQAHDQSLRYPGRRRPASQLELDPIGIGEVLPGAPGRIRCIRERRFKYARYVDSEGRHPDQHEMYDLDTDPPELENLAHPDHPRQDEPTVAAERERLAARLAQLT